MPILTGEPMESNLKRSFTTNINVDNLSVVDLGVDGNYVVLVKTAINNSPTCSITGNLGLSPEATSYISGLSLTDFTGYASSAQITGTVYIADLVTPTSTNLTTAVKNMITAYNNAAGHVSPDFVELGRGNIGVRTLNAVLCPHSASGSKEGIPKIDDME